MSKNSKVLLLRRTQGLELEGGFFHCLNLFAYTFVFLFEKQGLINVGCWAMLDVLCFTLGGPSLTAWKAMRAGVEI